MHDLALLANRLISDFPQFYPMFAEREYSFDERAPKNKNNRNPLLGLGIGADGLKTGHTQEAGFGLVGSAKQGNRRVIFVISGLDTAADRARESEAIVNWAFRQFIELPLGNAGEQIAQVPVAMGAMKTVGLKLPEDLSVLAPVTGGNDLAGEVIYNSPLHAPITKGDTLAELVITRGDLPAVRVPLVASASIAPGGFMVKVAAAAKHLFERLIAGLPNAS